LEANRRKEYPMLQNVGRPDQIIRIIAGVVLLALPSLMGLSNWGSWGSYVVGAVLIATAVFRFCPIYAALGLSTRRKSS
jgi:hypothetical protein